MEESYRMERTSASGLHLTKIRQRDHVLNSVLAWIECNCVSTRQERGWRQSQRKHRHRLSLCLRSLLATPSLVRVKERGGGPRHPVTENEMPQPRITHASLHQVEELKHDTLHRGERGENGCCFFSSAALAVAPFWELRNMLPSARRYCLPAVDVEGLPC